MLKSYVNCIINKTLCFFLGEYCWPRIIVKSLILENVVNILRGVDIPIPMRRANVAFEDCMYMTFGMFRFNFIK